MQTGVEACDDSKFQDELGDLGVWATENQVMHRVLNTIAKLQQPAAAELLAALENELGPKVRWVISAVISRLSKKAGLNRMVRDYFGWLLSSGELHKAIEQPPEKAQHPIKPFESTLDELIHRSSKYRGSPEFLEMVRFMGLFREYAPFNNMLVRLQNPACSFFATERDWKNRFDRRPIDDARPMLILAPMRPVILVYDLDQTEGAELPKELREFGTFEGKWQSSWLERLVEGARRHDHIKIDFKTLSTTNAGFATTHGRSKEWKMRVAIHDQLDEPSRFGVLCHELAHIYLGHLGTDKDGWWPCRQNLTLGTIEIEAEAVAFIVASRFGLSGTSDRYLSRHLCQDSIPASVSLELIGKVSARIEGMCKHRLTERSTPLPTLASTRLPAQPELPLPLISHEAETALREADEGLFAG